MPKHNIAFLGSGVALLTTLILAIMAVYISYIAPQKEGFIFYLGLSSLGFVFISVLLFRWGHKLLMAEQLQKMLDDAND